MISFVKNDFLKLTDIEVEDDELIDAFTGTMEVINKNTKTPSR